MSAVFRDLLRRGVWCVVVVLARRAESQAARLPYPRDPTAASIPGDTAIGTLATRVRGARQLYDLGPRGMFAYQRPVAVRSAREIPATVAGAFGLAIAPRNLPEWGAVAATTLGLYAADEWLLDQTRSLARRVGLAPRHPSVDVRVGSIKLIALPTTLGSALYFLGDGWSDLAVAGGFLVHGMRTGDNRAYTTASEITTGLVSLGVYTQLLKRSFGRQTPSEATVSRGRWRPFPGPKAYNANTPGFDAMPSGHLAAAMSTVEIVALNYPEKRFVRPLGYSLMGLLSFAMVNTGVHWVSDYPLALLIGGGVARVAVSRGRTEFSPRTGRGVGVTPILTPHAIGLSLPFPRHAPQ